MGKWVSAIFMTAVMVFSQCHIASAAIPKKYWSYQQPFINAVNAKNNPEIIRLGTEIMKVFQNQPLDKDKAGILYSTYDGMYPAYERQGNYEMAIKCLKAQVPYGEYLGFTDGVKIAKARIRMIDPMTEVYALTQDISLTPYYGMKHEPRAGTYWGRVFTKDGQAPFGTETAISFYVECLQENVESYDYLLRPYANGDKIIHIALNMPNENDSLKAVLQPEADSYLRNTLEYLKSLNAPVLLRIGAEMNVWQNLAQPEIYKQAYIKIANMARTIAPNVGLVFSPNDISNWNADISNYYPGDAYVDWVGVSLYTDKYRSAQNPVAGKDFEEMYYGNGAYANPITKLGDIVQRYGNKKPIFITECGIGSAIASNNTNLTDFAQKKMDILYHYVSMVYPQVKGIIYFDVDLNNNKFRYSLSKNPQIMAQYTALTQNNPTFLTSLNQTPSVYVKAEKFKQQTSVLQLASYCILPGDVSVSVTYYLDGKTVGGGTTIPYNCSIQTGEIAVGAHELKVEFKGANGYSKMKTYSLVKGQDSTIYLTAK